MKTLLKIVWGVERALGRAETALQHRRVKLQLAIIEKNPDARPYW